MPYSISCINEAGALVFIGHIIYSYKMGVGIRKNQLGMLARDNLGVTTAQASWLAQVGRGALIGQSACRLLAFARESIDCTRLVTGGSLHSAATDTTAK